MTRFVLRRVGRQKSSAIISLSFKQLEWVAEDFYLFNFEVNFRI